MNNVRTVSRSTNLEIGENYATLNEYNRTDLVGNGLLGIVDEESQVITEFRDIDILITIPSNSTKTSIQTHNIGKQLETAVRGGKCSGNHININYCVVDKIELVSASSEHPSILTVKSTVPELNGVTLIGDATLNTAKKMSKSNNTNNNGADDNDNPNEPNAVEDKRVINACFSLSSNADLKDLRIYKHPKTLKKESVLQKYGDCTCAELLSDLMPTNNYQYMAVRPMSVLEFALKINMARGRLAAHPESTSSKGLQLFEREKLIKIVKVVEKLKKENVVFMDLSGLKFEISRRDGLTFNDKSNSTFESLATKDLSEVRPSFNVNFRVRFTVKMFKDRELDDAQIYYSMEEYSQQESGSISPNMSASFNKQQQQQLYLQQSTRLPRGMGPTRVD